MSDKKYRCYGCNNISGCNELRYECMCVHHDDADAQYRGVCKSCVASGINVVVPPDHSLRLLHDLTPEFVEFCELANKRKANLHYENKTITMEYCEGPDGQVGTEFDQWLSQHTTCPWDGTLRAPYKKYHTIPQFEKTCTCCE